MFEDFMNHKCNIYHLTDEPVDVGYGIKVDDVKSQPTSPDLKGVDCHFHIRMNDNVHVVQREPFRAVEGNIKLSLPIGTDIRINDIVEDCRDGLKYRAGKPTEVHGGHHIIVVLSRPEGVERAI